MTKRAKTTLGLLITLLLALTIPFTGKLVQETQNIISKAVAIPANIVIDTQKFAGPLPNNWRAFAQGGEESTPYTLTPILNDLSELQPKYIRIDHIYDFYDVVSKNADGSLNFSFDTLDVLVRDILSTGAGPFFSLSYMPLQLAKDGNITSVPLSWEDWQTLVQKTIEHYSGREGLNLSGVYYEVWNEPDLFGRFKIGEGDKDYLMLYLYGARGAKEAQNTNQFYFGGPATTGAYPAWISTLANYAFRFNLPLDFVSWHFYGADLKKLNYDIGAIDRVVASYPGHSIQKIISEYGIDSENNPAYDNLVSAAYNLASIKTIGDKLDLAFNFSIKDGRSPQGNAFWGRWGLITHESTGKQVKPRFEALKMLGELQGQRLELRGGGTFIDGFAASSDNTIKVLLYNYDASAEHYESAPVTFTNLPSGIYQLTTRSLVSKTPISQTQTVADGKYQATAIMTPNDVSLLELKKTGSLLSFTQGRGESAQNKSLELVKGEQPSFALPADFTGGILSFWFKPYWTGSDDTVDYPLFNTKGAGGQSVFASFQKTGFTNQLVFGFKIGDTQQSVVSLPIRDWMVNSWHNLSFSFEGGKLTLAVDGQIASGDLSMPLLPQNSLDFKVAQGAIDDLVLKSGEKVILDKSFDGSVD